jgi:hypothetical protein
MSGARVPLNLVREPHEEGANKYDVAVINL